MPLMSSLRIFVAPPRDDAGRASPSGLAHAYRHARVALVANRCREHYNVYHQLDAFLRKVRKAPFISVLRETQNYVRAAERGLGIFELAPYSVRRDLDQWDPIIRWLNSKRSQPVT